MEASGVKATGAAIGKVVFGVVGAACGNAAMIDADGAASFTALTCTSVGKIDVDCCCCAPRTTEKIGSVAMSGCVLRALKGRIAFELGLIRDGSGCGSGAAIAAVAPVVAPFSIEERRTIEV